MATPTTNSWAATFDKVDHDSVLPKFAGLLSGTSVAERMNHACANPEVAFLLPQPDFSVKLVHHLHADTGNPLSPGSNELWGLFGGDSHAATLIVPPHALNPVKKTYKAPTWDAFQACSGADEIAALKSESKGPNESSSSPVGVFKPYGWLTPLPAFLAKALLNCRSTEPLILCLAATKAIVMHATAAASQGVAPGGSAPVSSTITTMGQALLMVPQLLWITHRLQTTNDTTVIPATVTLQFPLSTTSAAWGTSMHLKYIGRPLAQSSLSALPTDVGRALGRVATEIATMNSQRATTAASMPGAASSKTGFTALPVITQRLILHASSRLDTGDVRQAPLPSFAELLAFANASFVRDHLHRCLRSQAKLDIYLPTGFCSAVKTGSLISDLTSRPGLFSLFSCFRQPMEEADSGEQDALRMQLKLQDSSNGLSDKDIAKLTKSYHVAPSSFSDLKLLLDNFRGICLLLLGATSLLCLCLGEWVKFLDRGDYQHSLRSLVATDPELPAKVGWYVERRIQDFLQSCADATKDADIDISYLKFDGLRESLRDGRDWGLRLCPALRQRLQSASASGQSPPDPVQPQSGGGSPTSPPALNTARFITPSRNDDWSVFLANMDSCPITGMCLKYHINGKCAEGTHCHQKASHVPVGDSTKQTKVSQWIDTCRGHMKKKRQPPDGSGPPTKKQHKASPTTNYSASLPSSRLTEGEKMLIMLPHQCPSAILSASPLDNVCRTQPPTSPRSITGKRRHSCNPDASRAAATAAPVCSAALPVVPLPTVAPAPAFADTPAVTLADTPAVTLADIPHVTPLPPANPFLPSIPPVVLSELLTSILRSEQPACQPPLFQFEWTQQAADHNLDVLRQHDFDLDAAIRSHPFCAVTIGSEFRSADLLAPLLDSHPLWASFAERISLGSDYPLRPLSPTEQQADLQAMLVRGNHKSAKDHEALLTSMLQDEVIRAWQLPLPPVAATMIPTAVVSPLGLVHQFSIDEHANQIDKYRLTHDQSFNVHRGTNRSVNDRLLVQALNPCRFGRAFIRFLHHLAHLRYRNPRRRLLMTKVDCKSAYRRVHLAAATAVQAMVTIGGFLLVALRQTFGGAANPSQWSDISEVATDLANDLVSRHDWDPHVVASPHLPLLDGAHDADAGLDPLAPFAPASPLGVPYPDSDEPKFDCYIDDIFGAFLDSDTDRARAVIPLVLALLGRPVARDETLPRDDLLSLKKFVAEALPSERKTILGWLINSRTFTVALPPDKLVTWSRDLAKTIKRGGASRQHLETLLGRLNHAAYVVPHGRHFMGRLYAALRVAQHRGFVSFTPAQRDDLLLWESFLATAAAGISIDLLTYRLPSRVIRVDACPQGIGGYCLQSGIAWRYQLPPELVGCATLNTLEFLAAYVGLEMERRYGPPMAPHEVLLSQGDSTSATGWMRRSSFGDDDPIQLTIARAMAKFFHTHGLDSKLLFDLPAAGRSHLHRWEMAAAHDQKGAVTESTHQKRNSHWRAWQEFLAIVELAHDPFMQDLSSHYQLRLVSCFASAIRENGTCLAKRLNQAGPGVQSGTVRAALDTVASTFRANKLPSPIHDTNGRLFYILDRQLKGMKNLDPSTQPQKALPPSVLRHMVSCNTHPLDIAVGQLAVGAFFFAMRSCEYSQVRGERRTQLLQLQNLRFYKDKRELHHLSPALHLADSVSITFIFQKNEERDETVTMHRTFDSVLCPVRAWAALVARLRAHPAVVDSTPVNTVFVQQKPCVVTSVDILHSIRASVTVLGSDSLGFKPAEAGTHSLRSGAAMAMYLAGVPVYTIMLIGRWSSDAFLRYIRRQVQEFSSGVSSRMILSQDYFTIPDFASREDPRAPGATLNFSARGQVGASTQSAAARTTLSLWG